MNLAQFYTDSAISSHLISEFGNVNPKSVIDIGCGELGLLKAARQRWSNARLIGYDIDPIHATRTTDSNILLNLGDGLDPDLVSKIESIYGKIDLAVSNPPYVSVDKSARTQKILSNASLLDCTRRTQNLVPAELIFLAQNLLVMNDESELGIILPSGFISGERWRPLRELLLTEYTVTSCLELPSKAFSKTEVSTYALCIKKKKPKCIASMTIKISNLLPNSSTTITFDEALNRMDYTYYLSNKAKIYQTLSQESVDEIFRGNKTHLNLLNGKVQHIHTTDLKENIQIVQGSYQEVPSGIRFATAGDILISRVGTRCVGKSAYLLSGNIAISDCILVVRSQFSEHIWDIISKNKFREEMLKISLGSGAKYITKSILSEVFNVR